MPSFGKTMENRAARFLKLKGGKIIQRNFRFCGGEIDIIALFHDELVFIEVKALQKQSKCPPESKVNRSKRRKIVRGALIFLDRFPNLASDFRFDIITFEGGTIRHLEDAWTVDDISGI